MEREFVIHAHSGHGEPHYDLMLARGDVLVTWRLPQPPMGLAAGCDMPAKKLPDHRRAYLSYEGPVSGGRGQVKMLDSGSYELLAESPDRWLVRFSGRDLQGRWELVRVEPVSDAWRLARLADD